MEKQQIPTAMSPLATWLNYLGQLHAQTINLGLERIREVAVRLQLPKPAPLVFTVAGTNGKGTTCRMLEVLLLAAGYRVGVYSSPHLLRYTERVRIQGEELPEAAHIAAFSAIEAQREPTSLTFFEFSTLAALMLFEQAALDVVILEVGLGGRLDATNIIDPDVAVITSIALDHTDRLGADREAIGGEKAGIFRAGKPAIIGEADMPLSVMQVAGNKGAQVLAVGQAWQWQADASGWSFSDARGTLADLPLPQIPLPNAACALAALRASGLALSDTVIRQSVAGVALPGRFQTVAHAPRTILDVAHNPHAAAYLASRLAQLPKQGKVHAVVGMLHDKDIAGTLACLTSQVDKWYCASLTGPRAASAGQLAQYLPEEQVTTWPDVIQAWQAACRQASAQDIVLVCGSFHTVSQVMATTEAEKRGGK